VKRKAVILVSGGVDSATTVAYAKKHGFSCHALSVNYGQRHAAELQFAKMLCERLDVTEHKVVNVGLDQIGGSSLTDKSLDVPTEPTSAIPSTYVPARNTIMLSVALGWAEVLGAEDIFIGANAVDYSGYPDCRPEYISAYERLANFATRFGVEGGEIKIHAPLIDMKKSEIIALGLELGIDFSATVSCYQANRAGEACGHCDSCRIRRNGFEEVGIADPTRYFN
jgi:7-cyano-7-deazaguanine synthase